MISIFTYPRPFIGEFDKIQRNALLSWLKLKNVKIFIFNDENNTSKKVCEEYNLNFISEIKKNKNGTPLVDHCLESIKNKCPDSVIAHVSTDIILCKDFTETIERVDKLFENKNYYLIGRRIDIDAIPSFSKTSFTDIDINKLKNDGSIHPPSATDYLVFSKNFRIKMPPFIIGRPGWDNWLIGYCKKNKIPIIDTTDSITALHQNHSYPSKKLSYFEEECDYNFNLSGGDNNLMTLRESDYIYLFCENKIIRPKGLNFFLSLFSRFKFYGNALSIYRKIKRYLNKKNFNIRFLNN